MIFKCGNCGGSMVYDPERKAMYCEHCDSEDSENIMNGSDMASCVNCGAPMEVEKYTSATKCDHCGCYCVFEERVSGEYQPHLVLPFRTNKRMAKQYIKDAYCKNLFVPEDFLKDASLETIKGSYIPFWMYDYHANYDYEGTGKKIRKWRSGNTEYTETSIYNVQRNMDIDFDKIPVDASEKMPDGVMDLMEPYDYGALEDFHAKYMAGFYGEYYNYSADALEPRAKDKAAKYSDRLLNQTLTGYASVNPTKKQLYLDPKDRKYALLPIWHYVYKYRDKVYDFHVNGQSGKVVGNPPISNAKMVGYSIVMFLVLTAIAWLGWGILEVL